MRIIIRFVIVAILLAFAQNLSAQDKAEKEVIAKIERAAGELQSLSCTFKQVKSMKMLGKNMVSTGVMVYNAPDKLRWEYKTPYSYIFIIKNENVSIFYNNKVTQIDTKKNKAFREVVSIMLSSVTGGCISSGSFTATLVKERETSGSWVARLLPARKELKQLFKEIFITFDKEELVPVKVEMVEQNGDLTTIELKEIKRNIPRDEKAFKID